MFSDTTLQYFTDNEETMRTLITRFLNSVTEYEARKQLRTEKADRSLSKLTKGREKEPYVNIDKRISGIFFTTSPPCFCYTRKNSNAVSLQKHDAPDMALQDCFETPRNCLQDLKAT